MAAASAKRDVSIVWKFFRRNLNDDSQATCKLCNVSLKRGGCTQKQYGTGNLLQHLRSKHASKLELAKTTCCDDQVADDVINSDIESQAMDFQATVSNCGTTVSSAVKPLPSKQQSLEQCVQRTQAYDFHHPKAMAITKAIIETIALDMQPFSMVTDVGFRRLLKLLEPRYTIPSDRYFRDTALTQLYEATAVKVKELLSSSKWMSVTMDIWTSIATDAYMSLLVHFVTPEFETRQLCLQCKPFNESHTAPKILALYENLIQEWQLEGKIHMILRDSAPNMVAAFRNVHVSSSCIIHTLQLVLKAGCLEQPEVCEMLASARKLVGSFKHSVIRTKSLCDKQAFLKLPQHQLIQDVPTRWNSSYAMLTRLVEQKKAVIAVCAEHDIENNLTKRQWHLAEKVIDILQVFEEATLMASDSHATVAVIIPIVRSVRESLRIAENEHDMCTMKQRMITSMDNYFFRVEFVPEYAVATLLDPRFKAGAFDSAAACEQAKDKLVDAVSQLLTSELSQCNAAGDADRASSSNNKNPKWKLLTVMGSLLQSEDVGKQSPTTATATQSAREIVMAYLNKPRLPYEKDPLEYWKMYISNCGNESSALSEIVRRFLSAPPSSVSSERAFSSAADICDDKRNRLNPDKLDMLLFLAKNYLVVM